MKEIQRPKANTNEGTTPALSNEQARALLKAPPKNTFKGIHDRAFFPPSSFTASDVRSLHTEGL
jgi:hypothetical protein